LTKIKTSRFGEINYKKTDVINFVKPILGFNELTNFVLISRAESEPFKWLQSLENPDVCFVVIDPRLVLDKYYLEVPAHDIKLLEGSENQSDYQIYVIATVPKGHPEQMSINLQGPIVIYIKQLTALQLVLNNPEYDIRYSPFQNVKTAG
jgi:flagellar assembly factor FliW